MHVRVSGLVQGVGFRYFVVMKARDHDVRGWVRNQINGDVEVLAQGGETALTAMLADLRVGPRSAQVKDIRIDWLDDTYTYNEFEIR